jgi:hypothetical protein
MLGFLAFGAAVISFTFIDPFLHPEKYNKVRVTDNVDFGRSLMGVNLVCPRRRWSTPPPLLTSRLNLPTDLSPPFLHSALHPYRGSRTREAI